MHPGAPAMPSCSARSARCACFLAMPCPMDAAMRGLDSALAPICASRSASNFLRDFLSSAVAPGGASRAARGRGNRWMRGVGHQAAARGARCKRQHVERGASASTASGQPTTEAQAVQGSCMVRVAGIGGSRAGAGWARGPPLRMAVLCARIGWLWGAAARRGGRVALGNNSRGRVAGAAGKWPRGPLLPRTRGVAAPSAERAARCPQHRHVVQGRNLAKAHALHAAACPLLTSRPQERLQVDSPSCCTSRCMAKNSSLLTPSSSPPRALPGVPPERRRRWLPGWLPGPPLVITAALEDIKRLRSRRSRSASLAASCCCGVRGRPPAPPAGPAPLWLPGLPAVALPGRACLPLLSKMCSTRSAAASSSLPPLPDPSPSLLLLSPSLSDSSAERVGGALAWRSSASSNMDRKRSPARRQKGGRTHSHTEAVVSMPCH